MKLLNREDEIESQIVDLDFFTLVLSNSWCVCAQKRGVAASSSASGGALDSAHYDLAQLNQRLSLTSYLDDPPYAPTQLDLQVHSWVNSLPSLNNILIENPFLSRWFNHISSFSSDEWSSFPPPKSTICSSSPIPPSSNSCDLKDLQVRVCSGFDLVLVLTHLHS